MEDDPNRSARHKRVIKAPAVRRAELIDAAERLFLTKGYEQTTINHVIAATRLSKGAFYHHFRAKEDLLEAVAERVVARAVAQTKPPADDASLGALVRLNAMFDRLRLWKLDNIAQLRAVFVTMLAPANAVLYYRICNASISAMAPLIAEIIAEGVREGVFDAPDPRMAADALLWLGMARRSSTAAALDIALAGDIDGAAKRIERRVRAEGKVIDRILGLPEGSVDLLGPAEDLQTMIALWCHGGQAAKAPDSV